MARRALSGPGAVAAAVARRAGIPAGRATLIVLSGDSSEHHGALFAFARRCDAFDVRVERLVVGDYFIDGAILVERKTYADVAT